MALTQRGKIVIGVAAAGVFAVLAVLAFTGNAPGPLQRFVGQRGRAGPIPARSPVWSEPGRMRPRAPLWQ